MASLIKRSDVWYVVYNDFQGRQRWVKGYTDKRETQSLANRLEDEKTKLKRGDIDPKHEQRKLERAKPVDTHINQYEVTLKAKGNGENHVRYTVADIRAFVAFAGMSHADAIQREQMDRWVLSLLEAGVDSHATINRRVGSVKAFLKHLNSIGAVSEYVLFKFKKMKTKGHEKRPRRPLELDEQAKLVMCHAPQDRLDLYRFALGTGARHSGCVALLVDDVNFKDNTISLKVKDNQHRNKVHVVPMHGSLVEMLRRRCKGKDRMVRVFDVPPTRLAAKLLRADCKAAGIDTHHIDFHALRHTFITTLAKANIHPNVVQALAGHANVATTLAFYTHFKRADERLAVQIIKL
jgi:integrase/recombinase XerC